MFGIRQSAVRLAIILATMVLPTAAWSQSIMNFPRAFTPGGLAAAGFAIVNPGPDAAQVTYQLHDAAGQLIATSSQTIPARGQMAKLGFGQAELFQQLSAGGWVQATSATSGL